MKKLLLFFSISVFFIGRSTAQELTKERSKESFIEWNFGIAFLEDEDFVFPGTSVLWGKT